MEYDVKLIGLLGLLAFGLVGGAAVVNSGSGSISTDISLERNTSDGTGTMPSHAESITFSSERINFSTTELAESGEGNISFDLEHTREGTVYEHSYDVSNVEISDLGYTMTVTGNISEGGATENRIQDNGKHLLILGDDLNIDLSGVTVPASTGDYEFNVSLEGNGDSQTTTHNLEVTSGMTGGFFTSFPSFLG